MQPINLYVILIILYVGVSFTFNVNKHFSDYDDDDYDNLYKQWTENDDDPPNISMEETIPTKEELMKTDRPVLVFVHLRNTRDTEDAKRISHLWQTLITSAGTNVQRFVLDHDKIIFSVQPNEDLQNLVQFFKDLKSPYCYKYVIDSNEQSCEYNDDDANYKEDQNIEL